MSYRVLFICATLMSMLSIGYAGAKSNVLPTAIQIQDEQPIRVIDGDTFQIGTERIRLWGIDAPELHQKCQLETKEVMCGQAAKVALMAILKTGSLACTNKGSDRYGRQVSRCEANGKDVGGLLVLSGWALDYPQYSKGFYGNYEAEAKQEKRGVWQLRFVSPAQWRKGVRRY